MLDFPYQKYASFPPQTLFCHSSGTLSRKCPKLCLFLFLLKYCEHMKKDLRFNLKTWKDSVKE